eukprot:scaffold2504_cov65-Phaeocystis_antarctica.AAC.2
MAEPVVMLTSTGGGSAVASHSSSGARCDAGCSTSAPPPPRGRSTSGICTESTAAGPACTSRWSACAGLFNGASTAVSASSASSVAPRYSAATSVHTGLCSSASSVNGGANGSSCSFRPSRRSAAASVGSCLTYASVSCATCACERALRSTTKPHIRSAADAALASDERKPWEQSIAGSVSQVCSGIAACSTEPARRQQQRGGSSQERSARTSLDRATRGYARTAKTAPRATAPEAALLPAKASPPYRKKEKEIEGWRGWGSESESDFASCGRFFVCVCSLLNKPTVPNSLKQNGTHHTAPSASVYKRDDPASALRARVLSG